MVPVEGMSTKFNGKFKIAVKRYIIKRLGHFIEIESML